MLFFVCPQIFSQYYDTGQDPASIKWMQIKTDRFTLIYPESYGQESIRFAKSFDDSFTKLTEPRDSKLRKKSFECEIKTLSSLKKIEFT